MFESKLEYIKEYQTIYNTNYIKNQIVTFCLHTLNLVYALLDVKLESFYYAHPNHVVITYTQKVMINKNLTIFSPNGVVQGCHAGYSKYWGNIKSTTLVKVTTINM